MTYQGHGLPPQRSTLAVPSFRAPARLPSLLLSPPLRVVKLH